MKLQEQIDRIKVLMQSKDNYCDRSLFDTCEGCPLDFIHKYRMCKITEMTCWLELVEHYKTYDMNDKEIFEAVETQIKEKV